MTISELIGAMFQTANEKVSGVIAAGAIAAPIWHGYVKELSEGAAMIAPIIGVAYVAAQFWLTILKIRAGKQHFGKDETGD